MLALRHFPYGEAMTNKYCLLLIATACLSLTGCPGGGDGTGTPMEASSGAVVYLADQNTDGVFELFLASTGTKLNGPIISGGSGVTTFALTPDKTSVVYIADEKTAGVLELFQVNIASPGVSVKLNGTLVSGGDVESFAITPDGTAVVYLANQNFNNVVEVFRVLFTNPQASVLLNPAFPNLSGKNVKKFAVTPDSTKVVYIANQETVSVDELFQVAFANPQLSSTKLNNSPMVSGGNVTDFVIAPNSASVVYRADQNLFQIFELFLAGISGPGTGTSLNPPLLVSGQKVTTFAVAPDSAAVIYIANQVTLSTFELFRVLFAAPQSSVRLNGTPIAGSVRDFTIAANSSPCSSGASPTNCSAVVYSADQDIFGVVELFRVALSVSQPFPNPPAPGPAQKINPNFSAPQSVSAFAITPDSSAAVYLANQTVNTVTQLYRVPFSCLQANPPSSCPQAIPPPPLNQLPPLNGPLAGNVKSFSVTPNSTQVLYLADQTTFGVIELYAVNVGSPGTSSKLNGQLVVPGGNVTAFTF